ncbi:MAG: hypothetical protein NTV01_06995 [Bacteroidia bacterium]|nr:hypothetical protein [Bacteroidia bacterium]
MSQFHKYEDKEKNIVVYLVTEGTSKPASTFTMTGNDWVGRVYGGNSQTAIKQILKAKVTTETADPKETPAKETPEEKIVEETTGKSKMACVSTILRNVAFSI